MIYLVLEMLAAGETSQDIIKAHPQLSKEAIGAALMFAAKAAAVGERYRTSPPCGVFPRATGA